MKPYDAYRFKNKINSFGLIVWNMMIIFSKIVLGLFVLITCFLYWENMALNLLVNGINIFKEVTIMILIVIISTLIIIINYVKNIFYKQ